MKDALGNELRVGDLVMLQLKQPWVHGRITELSEGGVVVNGQLQGSRIVVLSTHMAFAEPGAPMMSVVALRDDQAAQKEEATQRGIAPLAKLN